MKIGSAWRQQTTKEKKDYISLSLDEVILELYPELKKFTFKLWFNDITQRKNENSPDYTWDISKKQETIKNAKTDESTETDEERIPWE